MATITLSSHSIPEDAQAPRVVGILTIEGGAEGETFTFALADERFELAEVGDGQYAIVVNEGASFDYEAGARQYTIAVQATGSKDTPVDPASFQIDVTDVNEAPTDIVVTGGSVGDNADLGALVATLQAEDPDEGDEFSYTFVTDATGTTARAHDLFEIVDDQIIVKGELAVGTHSLWVKVTDSGNPALSYVKQITLTVTDANEPPEIVFEQDEVVEGAAGGTIVGALTVRDPDESGTFEYSLIETVDGVERPSTMFRIDANGHVVVLDGVKLLKNGGMDPTFTVKASDGVNTIYETYEIVLGENQEPAVNFDSIEDLPKTVPGGTFLGTIMADDPENDTVSYALLGVSKDLLRIDDSGNVYVQNGAQLSYGNSGHRSFTVEWFDGINRHTESFSLAFVNEAPAVTLTSLSILEGNPVNRVVGRVSAVDPEGDALTYKLVGDNASLFNLVKTSTGYDIVLQTGIVLDYENAEHQALTVDVEVSDGPPREPETLTIELADVDEAPVPTFSARAAIEGVKGGTIVGRLSASDPEGAAVSYELSSASGKYFMLVEKSDGSCDVVVRTGVTLDYENPQHLSFNVTVSDGENEVSRTLVLNLVDQVDMVTGTQRRDTLRGQSGADVIKGLGGDDLLIGNGGADTLYGGSGRDVLTGGGGQDVFVFDTKPSAKANVDRLTDFDVKDDSIWLENKVFTKLGKAGSVTNPVQINKGFFAVDKAKDKNDHLIYSKKTGVLSYDADGTGSKAAIDIARLKKGLALTAKEFFVI